MVKPNELDQFSKYELYIEMKWKGVYLRGEVRTLKTAYSHLRKVLERGKQWDKIYSVWLVDGGSMI